MTERPRITIRHPMSPFGLFLTFCAVTALACETISVIIR
jgi:hypothetical protein